MIAFGLFRFVFCAQAISPGKFKSTSKSVAVLLRIESADSGEYRRKGSEAREKYVSVHGIASDGFRQSVSDL